jgi:hypothetical protein
VPPQRDALDPRQPGEETALPPTGFLPRAERPDTIEVVPVEVPPVSRSRSFLLSSCAALVLTGLGPARFAQAKEMPATSPADYGAEARVLWRTVACGGVDEIPAQLPRKTIESHCKDTTRVYARFRRKWADIAAPQLATMRPPKLPGTVLYPFGGGDLLFALVVFPDATEITSISLERAGNVRVIDHMTRADFKAGLADADFMIHRLASVEYSFTQHMEAMQHAKLPIQLSLTLAALAAMGFEPVNLRYFELAADGSLRYLTEAELDAATPARDGPRHRHDVDAGIPAAYGNIELTYRPIGQPDAPLRTYRSIAGNLHDSQLTPESPLYRHLAQKGPLAAMTKAASYLLWRDDFSHIRELLLGHMVWMVSDSTGILPMHAKPAGFVEETYGTFRGSLLGTDAARNRDMIRLWHEQPARALGFRFGYPDHSKKDGHLLVTRKPGT